MALFGKPKYTFDVEVKDGVIGTIDLFGQLDEKFDIALSSDTSTIKVSPKA